MMVMHGKDNDMLRELFSAGTDNGQTIREENLNSIKCFTLYHPSIFVEPLWTVMMWAGWSYISGQYCIISVRD